MKYVIFICLGDGGTEGDVVSKKSFLVGSGVVVGEVNVVGEDFVVGKS